MALQPLLPAEQNNETSWYVSGLAGIASGGIKVVEGAFSLGAELIDLGADTNTAAQVEMFFDKLNIFEDAAEDTGVGKLVQTLVQIGVPGTAGFKLGSKLAGKYFDAKKAGTLVSAGSKNLTKQRQIADKLNQKAGYAKFGVGAIGGATGEAFVADVEEIGSFGDMFDRGPTQLDTFAFEGGRQDATRKLMNRFKFGSESLLLTPFVAGVGKSAKALATRGQELAYSNSRLERFLAKIASSFTPEGDLTRSLFSSQKVMEGFRAGDLNKARELIKDLDKGVSKAFPQMQEALDRSLTPKEKEQFYNQLNDLLFDGDLTKLSDPKKTEAFVKDLSKKGVDEKVTRSILDTIDESRVKIGGLIESTGNLNSKELKKILQDRIKGLTKNTYKIFEKTPILGVFGRYKPTDESMTNAIDFFRRQIAEANKDITFDPNSIKYYEDAKSIVDKIIADGLKARKSKRGLADPNYVKKTITDLPGEKFINEIIERTGAPPKVIRDLMGEISDPRYGIFNAITELSGMTRMSAMFREMLESSNAAQARGEKGAFWATKQEAEAATNNVVQIVKVDNELSGLADFKAGRISNPTGSMYTTKPIADALKRANGITEGYMTAAVRGREGATAAEKGASFLYRNLLLFPKATAQLAKTVFSIPTHLRNIISAAGFAAANGVLFEGFLDPKLLGQSFRKGWQISGVGNIKDTRFKTKEFEEAYRELLELGVVNSQVQIGDLRSLLSDINFGDKITDLDAVVNPLLSKLKKIPDYLQGKYVAEDDFWKITNYFVELNRRNDAYAKAGIKKSVRELKEEAADIVKNTVPNYAFVGDVVRTARLLPVGNFMSFPSEMIRTTTNIGGQAIKEMKHSKETIGTNIAPWVIEKVTGQLVKNDNPLYRVGATRAAGMAFYLTAFPTMLVEGTKSLYNVTEDEIQALRQFVPDWSRNSTLIPIRDEKTGELKYIDFSHSNAYDLIGRPFRTMANEIASATNDGDTILKGFLDGVEEAVTEVAAPFVDESIWTEASADISLYPLLPGRGGRTRDGRVLYTEQTPVGDRMAIKFRHLMEALLPSYRQYIRVGLAATKKPTKSGETLDLSDQIAGLAGFRPIKVDPLRAMGFKIAEYQTGIRNARREFTGGFFGLLRGGPISANDIINRYYESNKARFNVQKEMFKNINAAEVLGTSTTSLRKEFEDRQLSTLTFNNLRKGKYEPYFPSTDIKDRFKEIARDLGTFDVFKLVLPTIRAMRSEMKYLSLDDTFDLDLNDYVLSSSGAGAPSLPPGLPQPVVNQGGNTQQVNATTNLTSTEEALLSPEEKIIRQRLRNV
tara:strand:+ start:381 stop:4316 length:3936 start_codon:yes stop_codon:yes gene_type:complete